MRSQADRHSGSKTRVQLRRPSERRLAVAGFLIGTALGGLIGLFTPRRPRRLAESSGPAEPWVPAAMPREATGAKQPA
jgi:hypothetical protein